ncbi:IQ motif and SEC7 domain-containing protein 1-like [Limulus polyphemus]|uniref:IQ motif and SEC7 domain-containing protein 1-like n=1 Tax=Limulus polyphemus TaxID=6850 RepID=A0ABM1RW74_LIMPO|nr:IQ motif and SEC7 domain-containing protein 1-like [Limulus polyphemus]
MVYNFLGIDDGYDLDRDMLAAIYERIKSSEFKPGSDHVSQVLKIQQAIVGKKPFQNLAQPHRRLICYYRLCEVYDINRKAREGLHKREVFLFNDILMVTKIMSKKKSIITYTLRHFFSLCEMTFDLFETPHYLYGIRLAQKVDKKVLLTFNARSSHDRTKFIDDLKESIIEMCEMEKFAVGGRTGETEVCEKHSSRKETSRISLLSHVFIKR